MTDKKYAAFYLSEDQRRKIKDLALVLHTTESKIVGMAVDLLRKQAGSMDLDTASYLLRKEEHHGNT